MVKNLTELHSSKHVNCTCCEQNGFFVYTPNGADYHTCPLCGADDYVGSENEEYIKLYEEVHQKSYDWDEDENAILNKFDELIYYCKKCRIMFQNGCMHAVLGCTSNVYNGHLIKRWKYQDVEYLGCPQFENVREWMSEREKINVLEWVCPNFGVHCNYEGRLSKSNCPQYYHTCKCILK